MNGDRDVSWAITIKAMNANGSQLACAPGNSGIVILDTVTGKTIVNLKESGKEKTFVGRVRFSPDSRRIAAVCADEKEARLQIWDIDKPLAPRMLSSHSLPKSEFDLTTPEDGLFGCLRFSPDSRRLSYIAPGGKGIRVVDLSMAPPVTADLSFPEGVTAAEWHPSGRRLGVVLQMGRNTRKVVLWDLEQQKIGPACDTPFAAPVSASFSPDGRWLAVSSGTETVVVYGAEDCVERYRIEEAAGEIVRRLFWTAEGRLVTAGMMENLRIWQPSSDTLPIETVYRVKASGGFAASGDGRWLALFADSGAVEADPVIAKNAEIAPLADIDAISQVLRKRNLATLIDRATGQVVQTWPVPPADTNRLLFSPDGRLLVAFTPEGAVGWDIVSKKEMLRRKSPAAATFGVWEAGGFDLEGRLIGISSKLPENIAGKIKSNLNEALRVGPVSFEVWDLLNNKLLSTIGNIELNGLAKLELFSSGRSLLVCPFRPDPIGDQETNAPWEVYALPSGQIQARYPQFGGKGMQALPGRVSQDGRWVLVASVGMDLDSGDGLGQWTTRVHDLRTGAETLSLYVNNMFAIEVVDFSPDGNVLARAIGQGFAEVWDVTKKEVLFRWQPFEGRPVRDITFTQNGDIASVGKLSDYVPILQIEKLRPRLAEMKLDW